MSTGIEWAATDVSVGAPVTPTPKPVAPPAPSPTPHTATPIAWGSVLPWLGMAVLGAAVAWPYLKPAPPKPDSDANAVAAGKAYMAEIPADYQKALLSCADAIEAGKPMTDALTTLQTTFHGLSAAAFEAKIGKPVLEPLFDAKGEPIDRKVVSGKVRAVAKGVTE